MGWTTSGASQMGSNGGECHMWAKIGCERVECERVECEQVRCEQVRSEQVGDNGRVRACEKKNSGVNWGVLLWALCEGACVCRTLGPLCVRALRWLLLFFTSSNIS